MARTKKAGKVHDIEADCEALMIDFVAEMVIEDACREAKDDSLWGDPRAVEYLVDRLKKVYANSDSFRKKCNFKRDANKGRDTVYVFMEHWFASWAKKNARAFYHKLPKGYGWNYSPTINEQKRRRGASRSQRTL